MKRLALMGACALGLFANVTLAHHSFTAFDNKKIVDLQGSVIEWQFVNPHSHILMMVPGAKGAVTWDIEGNATNIMRRQGWTRDILKPGDPVHVLAHPMKDGSNRASLFYMVKPDGTRFYTDIGR